MTSKSRKIVYLDKEPFLFESISSSLDKASASGELVTSPEALAKNQDLVLIMSLSFLILEEVNKDISLKTPRTQYIYL